MGDEIWEQGGKSSSGCWSTCVSLGARAEGVQLWDQGSPGQLGVGGKVVSVRYSSY